MMFLIAAGGSDSDFKDFAEGYAIAKQKSQTYQDINGAKVTVQYRYRCRSADFQSCYGEYNTTTIHPTQPVIQSELLDREYDPNGVPLVVNSVTFSNLPDGKTITSETLDQIDSRGEVSRIDYEVGISDKKEASEKSHIDNLKNKQTLTSNDQNFNQMVAEYAANSIVAGMNAYEDYKNTKALSEAMYEEYQRRVTDNSHIKLANQNYQNSVNDQIELNRGIRKAFMAQAAGYISQRAQEQRSQRELQKSSEQAYKQLKNRTAVRSYNYSKEYLNAEKDLALKAKKNLSYRDLARYAESLYYQEDKERQAEATEVLSTFTNEEGILQVNQVNSRLPEGAFDSKQFKTNRDSEAGQVVRRVANRYQVAWAQKNGMKYASDSELAAYYVGSSLLSISDDLMANESTFDQGDAYLKASDSIVGQIFEGLSDGFMESAKETYESVPVLAKAIGAFTKTLVTDPGKAWEQTASFIKSTPRLASALWIFAKKVGDTAVNGSAYERSKLGGKVLFEGMLQIATGGVVNTVKNTSLGMRIGQKANTFFTATREMLENMPGSVLHKIGKTVDLDNFYPLPGSAVEGLIELSEVYPNTTMRVVEMSGELGGYVDDALEIPNIVQNIGKNIGDEGLVSVGKGKVVLDRFEVGAPDGFKGLNNNPLKNTIYTDKVRGQMENISDWHHSFPNSVDGFSGLGKKSMIIGGDGVKRTKIELQGSYRGKDGHFEWIIEPNKNVNHRKFISKD